MCETKTEISGLQETILYYYIVFHKVNFMAYGFQKDNPPAWELNFLFFSFRMIARLSK